MVFLPFQEIVPLLYWRNISLKLPERWAQVIPAVEIETMGKLYSRCTIMIISGCVMLYRLITYSPSSVSHDLLEGSVPERPHAIWKFAFGENSLLCWCVDTGPTSPHFFSVDLIFFNTIPLQIFCLPVGCRFIAAVLRNRLQLLF